MSNPRLKPSPVHIRTMGREKSVGNDFLIFYDYFWHQQLPCHSLRVERSLRNREICILYKKTIGKCRNGCFRYRILFTRIALDLFENVFGPVQPSFVMSLCGNQFVCRCNAGSNLCVRSLRSSDKGPMFGVHRTHLQRTSLMLEMIKLNVLAPTSSAVQKSTMHGCSVV